MLDTISQEQKERNQKGVVAHPRDFCAEDVLRPKRQKHSGDETGHKVFKE